MILHILLIILPIPALIILISLTIYHLTPLLQFLPTSTTRLLPPIQRLSTIVRRSHSNLPREFFNLPPRPATPSNTYLRAGSALDVRGKLVLLLAGQMMLSLGCGWGYLLGGAGREAAALLAISIISIPSTVLLLTVCSLNAKTKNKVQSRLGRLIIGGGGVTHSTIFPRILPLSLIPTTISVVISVVIPRHANFFLLALTSSVISALIIMSVFGGYKTYLAPKRGVIRLHETSLGEKTEMMDEQRRIEDMRDSESWITSPCMSYRRFIMCFTS